MSDPQERNDSGPSAPEPAPALWPDPWRAPAPQGPPRAQSVAPTQPLPPHPSPGGSPVLTASSGDIAPDPSEQSTAQQAPAQQATAQQATEQQFPYPPPPGSTPLPWVPAEEASALDSPRRRRGAAILALAVTLSLLAGVAGGVAGAWLLDRFGGQSLRTPGYDLADPPAGSTARPSDSVAGVAGAVLPSVVAIQVAASDAEGTGSGFVIDGAKGYILTNNHVVAAAGSGGSITVVLNSGAQERAEIVGRDPSYDLAVLQVERGDLPALRFGDSDAVVVGDPVVAIGAPLGLQGTVTTGIVSALNRPVTAGDDRDTSYINAIQTDAAINPGNSGGPLVNAEGQVIGINSAIARSPGSTASGSIGLGFAIPSKQAERTAEQLISTGRAVHPIIGVVLDRSYNGEGVKVMDRPQDGTDPVTDGGPADEAGIQPGDVIVAFNGRPVTEPDELVVAIRAQAPGDAVRLTVRRGGVDREIEVTLSAASN